MRTHTATSSGAAERVRVGADELAFRVTSGTTGGALLAIEVRMAPGGGPPMLHCHDAVEVYRVQHGELTIYLEDDSGEITRTLAGAGSVVLIPSGREHTIRNESEEEALAYVVFSPGSAIERFTREAGQLAAGGAPRPADLVALAERHGIQMTRSLPAARTR